METRWVRYYRPLDQRATSVQRTARDILTVLVESSGRLTARQVWRITEFLELKTRSYLALLEYEGMVDAVPGTGREPDCRRYKVCRCVGWGITERGREYLRQAKGR